MTTHIPPLGAVIAVGNQKGGVGKTTTTVHLAAALGQRGRACLVIDLDPAAAKLPTIVAVPVDLAPTGPDGPAFEATKNPSSIPSTLCAKPGKTAPSGASRREPLARAAAIRKHSDLLEKAALCEAVRRESRKRATGIEPATFSLGS